MNGKHLFTCAALNDAPVLDLTPLPETLSLERGETEMNNEYSGN
jgi:hypothetical protein